METAWVRKFLNCVTNFVCSDTFLSSLAHGKFSHSLRLGICAIAGLICGLFSSLLFQACGSAIE